MLIKKLFAPVRQVPQDKEEPAVGGFIPKVVAMGRHPAHPPAPVRLGHESSDGHLGQVLALLPRLPLFDRAKQVVSPVAVEVLAGIEHLDAVEPKDMPPVTGFVVIYPAESFDVVDDDDIESRT